MGSKADKNTTPQASDAAPISMHGAAMDRLFDMQKDIGRLEAKDSSLEKHLVNIEKKLDKMDAKFDRIDERFDKVDGKFDRIDERFDKLDGKIEGVGQRVSIIEKKLYAAAAVIALVVGLTVFFTNALLRLAS